MASRADASTMVEDVEAWLENVEGPEHALAAAALSFVRGTLEDYEEQVKWNQPCWVVTGANCLYLSAQNGYVNLGFFEGASLDDPDGRLEGSGDRMRHVKVRSVAALDDDLAALVAAAAARARG